MTNLSEIMKNLHEALAQELLDRVPASACRGLMDVPDFEAVTQHIPARYWPAVQRSGWWGDKHFPKLALRLDMVDLKGRAMGSLFATPMS
ncbi:hypothetical protein [Agrobacterium fabrum]|nr:hypothetical protein [Agrobacterium fabrum]